MSYQELFERCRLALKSRDITLAEKLANTIIQSDPEDPAAHILVGNVCTAKGEINKAIQAYQHSIELFPNNPEGFNNIGLIYRKEGNLPAATKALEQALILAPDRADICYNLGNVCKAQGNSKKALKYFQKAINIDPDFILGYNSLALACQQDGKANDALKYFNKALDIDNNHPTIRLNLGVLEENSNNPSAALVHYKIAVRSKPGWIIGLQNLARIQYQLGLYSEAESTFKNLVSLSPKDLKIRLKLAECISFNNRKEEAVQLLEQILREHPGNSETVELIGKIYTEIGDLDRAEQKYRSLLAVQPELLTIRINLAELLLRNNKYAEAAEQLQYVMSKDKSRADAYYILGRLARKQGDSKHAVHSFEMLLSLDPDFIEARFQLANLYRGEEQFKKATKQLKLILKQEENNIDARKLLAELYLEQKKYSEALTHFLSLHEEKPDDQFIIDSIQNLYKILGEKTKAVKFAESLYSVNRVNENTSTSDELDHLQQALNVYDSVIEQMPAEFNEQLNRNLQRLNEPYQEADETEEPQEENLYFQDYKEIAGEVVPIIDVGGIEPVIAVNEEDRETIFLDEQEEELESYPELDEKPEKRQKMDGSFNSGPSQQQPQSTPVKPQEPAPQHPQHPQTDSKSGFPGYSEPEHIEQSPRQNYPPQNYNTQPMPPQQPQQQPIIQTGPTIIQSPPQPQSSEVSMTFPQVITIKVETPPQPEMKINSPQPKKKEPKSKPKQAKEKTPVKAAAKPDKKAEVKADTKPEEKKKLSEKIEDNKKKKEARKKKDGRKEKAAEKKDRSDKEKREDLFSYLENLTKFLPTNAKKDFKKSGVKNKIEKLRDKFQDEDNINK